MKNYNKDIRLIVIDSFCGAGGVTEGFHHAEINGIKIAKVIIGINHDSVAIESHKANHPDTHHFVEDFTELDPYKLISIINEAKKIYPNAKVLFWASAECTHYSKAKGGLPRDPDSRSLPEHIERYVKVLNPDIIGVENVREFLDWGQLDENGKPIKKCKGEFYQVWRDNLISHGYIYDYKIMNAADYGAFTSRIRYFGIFAKNYENIAFPKPTHSRKGDNDLIKWKEVRDVLELQEEGKSIFDRKKPLVDATLRRIIEGVKEFAIKENENFLLKYNSMNQQKKCKCPSVNMPSPVVSTQGRLCLVKAKYVKPQHKERFCSLAYSGNPKSKNFHINQPAKTITTIDHHQFITAYYGNGFSRHIKQPCATVTTKDRFALITSKFIDQQFGQSKPIKTNRPIGCLTTNPKYNVYSLKKSYFLQSYYSGGGQLSSISEPHPTIMTIPKQRLIDCHWLMDTQFSNKPTGLNKPFPTLTANRKHFYLMNPQYQSKGSSINKPCFTLIARMDKMPPYLMQTIDGTVKIKINDSDSPVMVELKTLCNKHGIIDILMRMLLEVELKRIMGFGDDYVLLGTKADRKKFIGNAVECGQAKVLAEAIGMTIN